MGGGLVIFSCGIGGGEHGLGGIEQNQSQIILANTIWGLTLV